MKLTVIDDLPIGSARFNAVLVDVVQVEAVDGPYLLWTFERGAAAMKRPTATHAGTCSAARQTIEALLRRSLTPGETIDTDDLIGRPVRLIIGWRTDPDGTDWPIVEAVTPVADDDLDERFS